MLCICVHVSAWVFLATAQLSFIKLQSTQASEEGEDDFSKKGKIAYKELDMG